MNRTLAGLVAAATAALALSACASSSAPAVSSAPPSAKAPAAASTPAATTPSASPALGATNPDPPSGEDGCPSITPGSVPGLDPAQTYAYGAACDDWAGQVSMQLGNESGTPGQRASGWCHGFDETDDTAEPGVVGTDTPAQLQQACRDGIAFAGGPAANAP